MKILGAHWHNKMNVGDLMSSPLSYFRISHEQQIVDIKSLDYREQADIVIIGGGAVSFRDKTKRIVTKYSRRGVKVIIWGTGLSRQGPYPEEVNHCTLTGFRDATDDRWVPCASCMHPAFDREYPITHDVVFYQNAKTAPIEPCYISGPLLGNDCGSISRAVSFLASGNIVVTSSYHGMYWATLLGRRVIAIPFSNKFFKFKHPPQYTKASKWSRSIGKTVPYYSALEECRAANRRFHGRVMELVSSVQNT